MEQKTNIFKDLLLIIYNHIEYVYIKLFLLCPPM